MKLVDSKFPFSKRMLNFFNNAGISTTADLTTIPLPTYTCFRGFKNKSKKEFIAYIEFEQIQEFFDGFHEWKQIPSSDTPPI